MKSGLLGYLSGVTNGTIVRNHHMTQMMLCKHAIDYDDTEMLENICKEDRNAISAGTKTLESSIFNLKFDNDDNLLHLVAKRNNLYMLRILLVDFEAYAASLALRKRPFDFQNYITQPNKEGQTLLDILLEKDNFIFFNQYYSRRTYTHLFNKALNSNISINNTEAVKFILSAQGTEEEETYFFDNASFAINAIIKSNNLDMFNIMLELDPRTFSKAMTRSHELVYYIAEHSPIDVFKAYFSSDDGQRIILGILAKLLNNINSKTLELITKSTDLNRIQAFSECVENSEIGDRYKAVIKRKLPSINKIEELANSIKQSVTNVTIEALSSAAIPQNQPANPEISNSNNITLGVKRGAEEEMDDFVKKQK